MSALHPDRPQATARARRAVAVAVLGLLATCLGSAPPGHATASGTSAAGPVPVNDCWSTDNGDPVLTGLSVTPTEVTGRPGPLRVTFRATGTDTGGPSPATGVRSIIVWLSHEPGGGFSFGQTLFPTADGAFAATMTTARPAPFGTFPEAGAPWLIHGVSVNDRAGNLRNYRWPELQALGLARTFTVTPFADRTAPRLLSVTAGPARADTRRNPVSLRLLAHVRDPGSGVAVVGASVGFAELPTRMRKVRGSLTDSWWRVRLPLPRWRSGTLALSLFYGDFRGNTSGAGPAELRALGAPTRVRVTAGRDRRPAIVRVRAPAGPTRLDLEQGDAILRVTARVRDAVSGAERVFAFIESPDGFRGLNGGTLHRVSGTRRDGVWSTTIRVRRCASAAGRFVVKIGALDRAGNLSPRRVGPPIDITVADHERPSYHDLNQQLSSPTAPISLRFTEPVLNLTAPDVQVRKNDLGDQFGTTGGQPVPGTWTCTDAAAATVDCATGPVTTATFAPAQPWEAGRFYQLELAAAGTLGVRDLAGNPVSPSRTPPLTLPQ